MEKKMLYMSIFFIICGLGVSLYTNFIEETKAEVRTTSSFKIGFTEVYLDGYKIDSAISRNARTITFEPKGEEGVLSTIKINMNNYSKIHKAKVLVTCKPDKANTYDIETPDPFDVDPELSVYKDIYVKAKVNLDEPVKIRCNLNVQSVSIK